MVNVLRDRTTIIKFMNKIYFGITTLSVIEGTFSDACFLQRKPMTVASTSVSLDLNNLSSNKHLSK